MDVDRRLLKSSPLQPLVDTLLLESLPDHPLDFLSTDPHPSDLTLALFSSIVYTQKKSVTTAVKSLSEWEMLDKPEGGWRLLTTGSNSDLNNGYFGAAYVNTRMQQVVVSHRGTIPSLKAPGSLITDALGICWKHYTACTNSAVTFVGLIRQVIFIVNTQHGRRYNLVITGHSLGGWLAQITAFTVKCLEVSGGKLVKNTSGGVHARTVVFDSPGVKTMLNIILDSYYDRYTTNILDRLNIVVYVSAPNRINTCGAHLGSVYRLMIDVEKFNILDRKTPLYNTKTHGVNNFISAFSCKSDIYKVFDWPKSTDEFVMLFGKDALNHGNEYHKDLGKETTELNKKIQRYNTDSSRLQSDKEIMVNFKIFDENELHVLSQLTSIQKHQSTNEVLNKFVSDKKNNFEERNFFPDVEIDHANRTITCKPEHLLREFTNRFKQVMRWFETDFTALVRDQIVALPLAIDSFYRAEGQNFLDSLPESLLNFNDSLHLQEFLLSDTARVLSIVTKNGSFEICRLHNLFSQIKGSFIESHQIDKYTNESHYTFLDWSRLQNLFKIYGLPIVQNNLMIVDGSSISTISSEVCTFLNGYLKCSPSNFKKIVFISSNPIYISNTYQSVQICPVDREISLMDLTEESQKIIVERKVIFTGSKSFSFQEFLGEKCSIDEINHLISSDCLKGITTNEDYLMNIEDTRPLTSDLQMPFVKTHVTTSMEYVLNCIKMTNTLVVISLLNSEDLEAGAAWEQLNGKIILAVGDTLEEVELFFKDICNKNKNQIIYLLEVSGDAKADIKCKQIFNRGFYVPRKFIHRTSIDFKRFAENSSSANNMFVICSDEHKASLLGLIGNCDKRKEVSKNLLIAATKEEEIDVIERHFSKNIHFVEIDQSSKLEWRFSHGSVERLLYYMSMESFEPIDEQTLSRTERNLVFLTDEPGMGKTTSLARFSRLIETAWVIHIELKKFKTHIEKLPTEFTPKNVEKFLLSECCSSADDKLAHGSLEYLLKSKTCSKRVVVMFDGFDEIEDYVKNKDSSKEKLVKLIAFLLSKPTIQVFLTARKYLKESLETDLNQFSTSFVTINTQEQQNFLFMFWKSFLPLELDIDREKAEEGLTEYAGEVLRRAKQVLGSDMNCFMGVPLQLRMLAEVFRPKSHLMIQPLEDLYKKINIVNAPNLYKKYIALKYDIYIHDKTLKGRALEDDEILEYTESLNKNHGELGFRTFFAEFYDSNKNNFNKFPISLIKLNRLGLIESKEIEKFDFVHRTYAEYFCAQIVIHLLNQSEIDSDFKHRLIKDVLLTKILLHPDSKIIRLFLNVELGEMKKSDTILQQNAEHIKRLWFEENSIFRNDEHQTALHVAVKERNEHIITFMLSGLYYESTQDAFVTLITQYDINNEIALHIMDQPSFHGKIDDGLLCNTIMEMFFKCFVSFSNETKEKILFACLFKRESSYVSKYLTKSGNVNAKTLPEFKKVEKRVKVVDSLVGRFEKFFKENNVKQARLILSIKLNNNVERYCLLLRKQGKDKFQSALHIAAKNGHIDAVQLLAEILTPVPFAILMARPDENKKTALHTAAKCGHLDIVEYLVERGADINARCKTGQSALMYAAKKNFRKGMVCFVEVGGKSIKTSDCVKNKSHTDAEQTQLSIIKCLVEKDANKNFKDARGLTAVQQAADNYNFLIVEYLIDGGADISLNNIINEDRETALHKAAQRGRHTSVDYLLKKGADPDRVDKQGWTALSWASLQKAWVMVQVLLDGKADVNADGGQAFYFAIWWKEWSVVKSLIDKGACFLESKITFDLSEFKENFPNYVFK